VRRVTGPDAAALLRVIDTAHLFWSPSPTGRHLPYHRLVRQVLRNCAPATGTALLHQRAAEWYEAAGDTPRATRHFFAARQIDRGLVLMQDRVVTDFLQNPADTGPLDLTMLPPAALARSPDQVLTVAADLLIHGSTTRAGDYLDLLGQIQPAAALEPRPAFRLAALQCFYYALTGAVSEAEGAAGRARAVHDRTGHTDEWDAVVPLHAAHLRMPWKTSRRWHVGRDAALAAPGLR
jgi:ATP/maltotriose-dependent transcriptional regulator MalT